MRSMLPTVTSFMSTEIWIWIFRPVASFVSTCARRMGCCPPRCCGGVVGTGVSPSSLARSPSSVAHLLDDGESGERLGLERRLALGVLRQQQSPQEGVPESERALIVLQSRGHLRQARDHPRVHLRHASRSRRISAHLGRISGAYLAEREPAGDAQHVQLGQLRLLRLLRARAIARDCCVSAHPMTICRDCMVGTR